METLKIEIQIHTRKELTPEQKQQVLGDVRVKMGEYLSNPPEFVDLSGFRIFKHMTDEEIADALMNR